MKTGYLIIGTGAAGFYAAEKLKEIEPFSLITVVGKEKWFPYKRTKINKEMTGKEFSVDKFYLAPEKWFSQNKIKLITGNPVESVDIPMKAAELEDGTIIEWGKLLLAVGAEPYCPDPDRFKNGFSLRSYGDAVRIRNIIQNNNTRYCLVYGLGTEGLETADRLNSMGMKVVLAGRGNRVLSRYFSVRFSEYIAQEVSKSGIELIFNVSPEDIIPDSGIPGKTGINSKKGSYTGFDLFLYSTGIMANTDLALKSGLAAERGIRVSSGMETSSSDVYAAGDCIELNTGSFSDHWHAAQDQGRTAAVNMAGGRAVWPARRYRIKTELKDLFCFSMRSFSGEVPGELLYEEMSGRNGIRAGFYFRSGHLDSVEMLNDRERAKMYEKAINEKWSKSKVLSEFY